MKQAAHELAQKVVAAKKNTEVLGVRVRFYSSDNININGERYTTEREAENMIVALVLGNVRKMFDSPEEALAAIKAS